MTPELTAALARATAAVAAMTPEQRAEMYRQQRESFVRGEAGLGSDRDESAYRAAVAAGDTEAIARLNAEADARVRRAREIMETLGG